MKNIVKVLFNAYLSIVDLLPKHWQPSISALTDQTEWARVVSDYIAGMTDRFALQEYQRITS